MITTGKLHVVQVQPPERVGCLSGLWPRLIKTFSTAHGDDDDGGGGGGGGGGEGFENIQIQTHGYHMALSWSEHHVLLVIEGRL